MRIAFAVAIAAGIVGIALVAIVASTIPTKDYDLSVDAMKDEQSLFTNTRVVLKNTGRLPLTNVLVDYGSEREPAIPVLQPGESWTMSPPEDVQLDSVTVSADPGIKIIQQYRTPIKLPGMIGS
ncbi:MAG: hypothetical protein ACREA4_07630 [Nitrososphaera sp.]